MHISSKSSFDIISAQSQTKTFKSSIEDNHNIVDEAGKIFANDGQYLLENSDELKVKVQEAVTKMNEMLEVNNSASKFLYHEGLERYYVTVVDRNTEEIVKEIPPRKLLDAFYEMQKMLGMIVDEKI